MYKTEFIIDMGFPNPDTEITINMPFKVNIGDIFNVDLFGYEYIEEVGESMPGFYARKIKVVETTQRINRFKIDSGDKKEMLEEEYVLTAFCEVL